MRFKPWKITAAMPCGRYFPSALAVSECSHRCQSQDYGCRETGYCKAARGWRDLCLFSAKGMTALQTVATRRRA